MRRAFGGWPSSVRQVRRKYIPKEFRVPHLSLAVMGRQVSTTPVIKRNIWGNNARCGAPYPASAIAKRTTQWGEEGGVPFLGIAKDGGPQLPIIPGNETGELKTGLPVAIR
jgi:hypothetical protein